MWTLFWVFVALAGWVFYFVVEGAYSDLRVERDLLLAGMRADDMEEAA